MAREAVERGSHGLRARDHVREIGAADVLTGVQREHRVLGAFLDEVHLQLALVLEIALGFAAGRFVCVAGSEMFTDVPSTSVFCRWIEELARRGVVTGCGPNLYCPSDPVTREQMGVFLSATFGLTLYSAE